MAKSIPALWFTGEGLGPDRIALDVRPLEADLDGRIAARLAIRIRESDQPVIGAQPLVNGGFSLDRDSVEKLHHQLGVWLAWSTPGPRAA